MSIQATSGDRAVMNRRLDPADSLDFFPTPPWATRALLRHVLPDACGVAWEPAAGEGHMAAVLGERFDEVYRTDVHDYGGLHAVGSFVGESIGLVGNPSHKPDWIITNPPFNTAAEFALRGLELARCGVALLVRSNWAEGGKRYTSLFNRHPPSTIAQFSERVPMVKGRWDPSASTATAYAWFVWEKPLAGATRFIWIPPGCRTELEMNDDRIRFSVSRREVV